MSTLNATNNWGRVHLLEGSVFFSLVILFGVLGCSKSEAPQSGFISADTSTGSDDTVGQGEGEGEGGGEGEGQGEGEGEGEGELVDADGDGWFEGANLDCDDSDPTVNPGETEVYDPPNGKDDDCDGKVDEEPGRTAVKEDWDMYLTVDNMFDVYFGTPNGTTGDVVGRGANWQKEFHFTATGRLATDYMYVATASDHSVAQGFVGTFKNITLNKTTNTGDTVWQVFPAGAYEATNPNWPNPWPASTMPTQAQVNTAIAYAQANDLWVTPVSPPGYDNDLSTPIAPATSEWITHCNPPCTYDHIPKNARWIWYDSGRGTSTSWANPLAGFNHDEFLVFRVAGAVAVY